MIVQEYSIDIEYLRIYSTDVTVLTQVHFVPEKDPNVFNTSYVNVHNVNRNSL